MFLKPAATSIINFDSIDSIGIDFLFDKIYVVWGRDPLRREYIEKSFASLGIQNYKFVKSISPQNFYHDKTPRFKFIRSEWVLRKCKTCTTPEQNHLPVSLGEISCSYGHLKAYKTALADGCKNFLVVEDDIVFDKDILYNVLDWKDHIPSDWDIIHYHSWHNFDNPLAKFRKQVNKYFYTGYKEFGGAVCYALTARSAKQLLAGFIPIQVAADGAISCFSLSLFSRRYYNSYVMFPFLAKKTIFDSQIDEEQTVIKKYKTRNQRNGKIS